MTHGVYRIHELPSGEHRVHVQYDTLAELDITEQRYRDRGYQPKFEQLPWKDEYEATIGAQKKP